MDHLFYYFLKFQRLLTDGQKNFYYYIDLPEFSEKLIGNYGPQNWRGITHTRKSMIDNSRGIFTKMQLRFQVNGQDS